MFCLLLSFKNIYFIMKLCKNLYSCEKGPRTEILRENKDWFRSLTITSLEFVVPIYISTQGSTWRKYGNGDARCKAAFVKSFIQFGSMMLWRPSYFVSNNYHQTEASFKSQSVQFILEMLVLRLLQGRMSVGEGARPRVWRTLGR